ncbi:MAG: hypothetical protein CMD78_05030 [Gammaproteobacteria bacterium]|nr:hypothetical protein [Gammaproteobacteria bacterium]|tara:strand:+ start:16 stop:906 length:891 start_codon:yes stop_codon:yes gene_type:complete
MLKNFLRQLTKATDIAIVIASALVVLAFLTSDYPATNIESTSQAKAKLVVAENVAKTAAEDLAIAKQVAEDVSAEADAAAIEAAEAEAAAAEAEAEAEAISVGTLTAAELADAVTTATAIALRTASELENAIATASPDQDEIINLLTEAAENAADQASDAIKAADAAATEASGLASTREIATTLASKAKIVAETAGRLATARDFATKAVAEAETNVIRAQAALGAARIVNEKAQLSAEDAMKFYVWWLQPIRDNTMILIDSAGVDGFIAVFAALIFYLAYKRRKSFFDRFFNLRFK